MPSTHLLVRAATGAFLRSRVDTDRHEIGRDPTNDLVLEESSVSRRHATIVRRDGQVVIEDEWSQGGTYLNGTRLEGPMPLHDGDCLQIGGSWILVREQEPTPEDERILEACVADEAEGRPAFDRAHVLYEKAAYTGSTRPTPTPSQSALFDALSRALQSATSLDDILTVLLGVAFDTLAPERGAILLRDAATGELRPRVVHPELTEDFVSRTIISHALRQRAALVVGDVARDERFQHAPSLLDQDVQAVVCCPLVSREDVVGVLYLDTSVAKLQRPREQIGLLNFVASYAATAIENALLLEERSRARTLSDLDEQPLVARSDSMKALVDAAGWLAGSSGPIWIEGATGTGKLLVARHIHLQRFGKDAPFLAIDCQRLATHEFQALLLGADGGRSGIWDQTAAGTLVLEHLDELDLLAQSELLERLEATGSASGPQLIATSCRSLEEFTRISVRLAESFEERSLRVPPLKERKEDILPLARVFLAHAAPDGRGSTPSLAPSAEATLVAAKYREANVTELRNAIELAVVLSGGAAIEAEHVFTGPMSRSHRLEFDLAANRGVRWFLRRRVQESILLLTVAIFGGLILACLTWPAAPIGRVANALVWGLWWPALLVVFVALGRLWCTYCPLSRVARWGQRLFSRAARPPAWLKARAPWVMAGLFLAIVWSEHVFAMPGHPFATGIFLLTLLGTALLLAMLTRGEVWCRFACPLGNMSACYSTGSTVHVHANPMICQSQCKTHECFKGTEAEPGCSMFLHPLYVKDSHFCKLCMACVRNCPNGSAKLWIRPPLQDLWSLLELNPQLVPLALTIFLLAPLLLGGPHDPLLFTALALGLVALVAPLRWGLRRLVGSPEDEMPAIRVAFCLSLLAWGPLMAFHLGNVPGLGDLVIRSEVQESGIGSVAMLPLLQWAAVLGSTLASFLALGRIRAASAGRGWWAIYGLAILYVALTAGRIL